MKNFLTFISFLILSSCAKPIEPLDPEKIFDDYKGSVVLIANQYYYKIVSNGVDFYYSPSSEKKIFLNENEVLENLSFSTGTGFIISSNGEIITNRHVVSPIDKNYKIELAIYNRKMVDQIAYDAMSYNDSIETIKTYYYENSDYLSFESKQFLENKYDELTTDNELRYKFLDFAKNMDFSEAVAKLVTVNISVAYNDTHVTEIDDLQECIVVKESKNDNIDLALIQTKSKSFNKPPNKIFNFNDNNPNLKTNSAEVVERDIKNPVKVNSDVYMIGFNRGFSLANTKQGIRSQFTGGKISQENDQEKILYTIPTLEGSSGSPIIDKWGNLVAVNFAKINDSQNFSFGIPVYQVKLFFEE